MATQRTQKVRAEAEKARLKLVEQQAKLRELEAKQTEFENMDIVDIVRGMNIPIDDLAAVLQSLKGEVIPGVSTSGQVDPKSAEHEITENDDTEDETE